MYIHYIISTTNKNMCSASIVLDYYDELLNCYNKETKLFNSYDILMERLIKRDYDGLGDSSLINEFISKDVLVKYKIFIFIMIVKKKLMILEKNTRIN